MSNLTDKDLIDAIMRGDSISLTYPNVSIGFIVVSQYELDKLGLEVIVNDVKQSRIFAVDASFTEIARSIKEFAEEAGNAPPLESVIDLLESTLEGVQGRMLMDTDLLAILDPNNTLTIGFHGVNIELGLIRSDDKRLSLNVVTKENNYRRGFKQGLTLGQIADIITTYVEMYGLTPTTSDTVITMLTDYITKNDVSTALTRCIEEDLLSNLAYSINVSNEKELAYLLKQATEKIMFMDIGTAYPDKRVTFRVGMHDLDTLFIEYSLYLGNEKITGLMKVPIKRYTKLSSLEYMDILNEVTAKFHNMRYARELDHLFRKWFVVYKDLVNNKCK